MKKLHHFRALRHKFQTEAQACDGKKQQPKERPPAKTDMKVKETALSSLTPLHHEPLPQLLSVAWQKNEYSAQQDKDKEQSGVCDYQLAHGTHQETGMELGNVGEEVPLCRCPIRSIL